jgi:L-aspartate oxidase
MGVLEGLTWALSCAENIEQHLSKFIYYFPELKASEDRLSHEGSVLLEDWQLLKQLMWNYVGIKRDRSRLTKGYVLLDQLKRTITNNCERNSIDRIHFLNSINTGLLIAYAALDKCASK